MKLWFILCFIAVSIMAVCFPDQSAALIRGLNSLYRELGITSLDDFAETGKELFNEVKGKLGQ